MYLGRFIGFTVFIILVGSIVLNIATLSGADEFVDNFGERETEEDAEDVLDVVKQSPVFLQSEKEPETVSDYPEDYLIKDYDGGVSRVITNPSVEAIKYQISQGNMVIGYLDTSVLNNPYYTENTSVFVSVIGYSDTHFVTSESGIRNGNAFVYLISDFMIALEASGDQVVAVKYPEPSLQEPL